MQAIPVLPPPLSHLKTIDVTTPYMNLLIVSVMYVAHVRYVHKTRSFSGGGLSCANLSAEKLHAVLDKSVKPARV